MRLALAAVLVAAPGSFVMEWLWRLHIESGNARATLETATVLVAFAAVALAFVHLRRKRSRHDLFLLAALVAAAVMSVVFQTLPAYGVPTNVHSTGLQAALTVVRAGAMLAAALTLSRRSRPTATRSSLLFVFTVVALVALSEAVDLIVSPNLGGGMRQFHPALAIPTLISLALLLDAALEFARRAGRAGTDGGLLTVAALLLAFAQLSRLAMPLPPADWLGLADPLRAGFFVVMLWTTVRMFLRSEAELAHEAVVEERLRIARDLHDGLAQDLALIAAYADQLARTHGADHPVAIAAARALAAARGRIVDLEASDAPSLEAALREVGDELEAQLGVHVIIGAQGADPADELDRTERRELVRIAREGIVNAVLHGRARTVTVTLGSRRTGTLLSVSDDGCGFEGSLPASSGTGLGLRAMRSRAKRLGARLGIADHPDGGGEVRVIAVPGSHGGLPDAIERSGG